MRRRPFRLWELVALTVALLIAVAVIAPHQLGVIVLKVCLVSLGGVVGYWLDRILFPYARPHMLLPHDTNGPISHRSIHAVVVDGKRTEYAWGQLGAAVMIRRAVIVAAAMVAVAIGL